MLATAAGFVIAWAVTQHEAISPVGWIVIALWAVCTLISASLDD